MATEDEITTLRLLTDITCEDPPYTNEYMGSLIDTAGDVEDAAVIIWRQKAAKSAKFVDTTESGSSRKLSQLQDQALKMAASLNSQAVVDETGYSFTIPIERR